ncbi:RED-like protein N-terminal region-domain-containing protein [Syncephalis plumigaleata]|nr:RED-like protein N-terminal region-domain-containing protein [Syncephalis plumigaleata]
MADQGLTQDDFRRLLQTPRPHTSQSASVEADAQSTQAAAATTTPAATRTNTTDNKREFARPRPRKQRPERSSNYMDDADNEDSQPSGRYRDRAKERREGINPDYAESERILASLADNEQLLADLHKEKHDEVTSERLARQQMEERSKLLGGDVSHTHLVKGLDYSLLDRRRREIQQDDIVDQDVTMEDGTGLIREKEKATTEQATSTKKKKDDDDDDDMQIRSGLARNIHAIAVVDAQQPQAIQLNELFRYGRMAYTFQLNVTRADGSKKVSDTWSIPTAVIRSKGEGQIGMRGSGSAANDLLSAKCVKCWKIFAPAIDVK